MFIVFIHKVACQVVLFRSGSNFPASWVYRPTATFRNQTCEYVAARRSASSVTAHAIVTPLLKKPVLDAANMANYRPVSNLSFISKVVERAVAVQLNEYLLPCYQSAYRKNHSTETALLRVWSDILMAADRRQVTLLCLLDLSSAFDCVDHDLLLQRFRLGVGMTDAVLESVM